MSKIKNGGLDQYGAEPFEQQQFGTAGIEGVKCAGSWNEIVVSDFLAYLLIMSEDRITLISDFKMVLRVLLAVCTICISNLNF